MIKYFHELTKKEFKKLCKGKPETWDEFARNYPQPIWCSYPEAVAGIMGCWSLVGFMVTGEDYCKNCDCYKPLKIGSGIKEDEMIEELERNLKSIRRSVAIIRIVIDIFLGIFCFCIGVLVGRLWGS